MRPEEQSASRIYDGLADGYGYDTSASTASRLKVRLLLEELKPRDTILDVGCGNGIHLRVAAPHCARAVGVDINGRMLSLAAERLHADGVHNAELRQASALALPFPDASFDMVCSFSTLLLVPDLHAALAEIVRVLRPGGTAVLDFAGRYNLSQLAWRWWYRRQGHGTYHARSLRQVRHLLSLVGLQPQRWEASGFCDQWKYVPLLRHVRQLDRLFHGPGDPDLDYRVSNLAPIVPFANRWYVVARRAT